MDDRQVSFEEMEHRAIQAETQKRKFFAKLFSTALDVLSEKVFLFCALFFAAGMFLWVMLDPSVIRLVAASLFVVGVFLPTLFYRSDKRIAKEE